MATFGAYSKYYNLLYQDKDYRGEADYLIGLLRRFAQGKVSQLMELGCGTGNHAFLFAEQDVQVSGVDSSEEMVAAARARLEESRSQDALPVYPDFHIGDVRNVRLGKTYDAVCSLFHVVSYQNSNEDILSTFRTAREHLKSGGLFIFDVWYGPAVLTDRPAVRVKRLSDATTEITRLAEPRIHADLNLVDVSYEVIVRDRESGRVEIVTETHHMRYLFSPEIEFFLTQAGFEAVLHSEEWMTGRGPGFDTWGVVFVARA
jgi:SAM-dependent methyltransferase